MPLPTVMDPIDVHVGQRLREIRRRKNLSQTDLAKPLGITFQQVQKYERGANRVSASTMVRIARFLDVPLTSLFEGLDLKHEPSNAEKQAQAELRSFVAADGGVRLIKCFPRLTDAQRRVVAATAEAMAPS